MENPAPEQAVANWQEPEEPRQLIAAHTWLLIGTATVLLIAVFIFFGWWLGETNYYIAAGIAVLIVITLFLQNHRPNTTYAITLTTERIQIGKRLYPLSELAGYWLSKENNRLIVTIEHKKPALIPASFAYLNPDENEARQILGQILPELEPRTPHFIDSLSRYFRI